MEGVHGWGERFSSSVLFSPHRQMRLPSTLPRIVKPLLCFSLLHTSAALAAYQPIGKQAPLSVFQDSKSSQTPAQMASDPDNLSALAELRISDAQTVNSIALN